MLNPSPLQNSNHCIFRSLYWARILMASRVGLSLSSPRPCVAAEACFSLVPWLEMDKVGQLSAWLAAAFSFCSFHIWLAYLWACLSSHCGTKYNVRAELSMGLWAWLLACYIYISESRYEVNNSYWFYLLLQKDALLDSVNIWLLFMHRFWDCALNISNKQEEFSRVYGISF